jgi:heterodisulfide reductase subunit A
MSKPVMVVGGGIAGIQASLDLAEMGIPVYLVESQPSIGGRMAQLDKTFPTNDCSTCILAPKMSSCANHPLIKIYSYSELKDIRGRAGDFTAVVTKKARYVDEEACNGCRQCLDVCPQYVDDDFNMGIDQRKAVYMLFQQGLPNVAAIDDRFCRFLNRDKNDKCGRCARICPRKAIRYGQRDKDIELEVGAIILATGYDTFAAELKPEYGYGSYRNVVTSMEYERIMSASGPYGGHIKRPDGKEPKRIAFLQCVGSRDAKCDREYCSSVCCMYAMKEAVITREHIKSIDDLSIYYMDMRAFGKDFERYYENAKKQGINFVRSRVTEIAEDSDTHDLKLYAVDEQGRVSEDEFDMVVLSVGLVPRPDVVELCQRAGIKTDRYGFVHADDMAPIQTTREGVLACGVLTGPKDIPETVYEASGAASLAAQLVKDLPGPEIPKPEEVPMRDIGRERPRIGVFVCHCGTNIAGVVDVKAAAEYAKALPCVEYVDDTMYACAADTQGFIADMIKEHDLNRVVVASCTPRTHEPLFQDVLRKSGLNPYLFTMVNIRDQCSWVHMDYPEEATEKAKDLIRMAVAKAYYAQPLQQQVLPKDSSALVIGGGLAGMTSALSLAKQGYKVYLVEKEPVLGGNARLMNTSARGRSFEQYMDELTESVYDHPYITVLTSAHISAVEGYVGNFITTVRKGPDTIKLNHGVIIVAVGANESMPDEYLYGQHPAVMTQLKLERQIKHHVDDFKGKRIVMIQCVGSREPQRPYCSRVCCTQAVKNAICLKEMDPTIQITILYREMRTYGMNELYYEKARRLGVDFVRYDVDDKPRVTVDEDDSNKINVEFYEHLIGRTLKIKADYLILSAAIEADRESNAELSQMLKVPINQDGFFLEAHMKLRPVEFATDGIFLCGMAHAPKNADEVIAQAQGAAARAASILAKEYITTDGMVAKVNRFLCVACGICESICPYKAIAVDPQLHVAVVNAALCKGCGLCSATCRPGAVDLQGFDDSEILAQLDALYSW